MCLLATLSWAPSMLSFLTYLSQVYLGICSTRVASDQSQGARSSQATQSIPPTSQSLVELQGKKIHTQVKSPCRNVPLPYFDARVNHTGVRHGPSNNRNGRCWTHQRVHGPSCRQETIATGVASPATEPC